MKLFVLAAVAALFCTSTAAQQGDQSDPMPTFSFHELYDAATHFFDNFMYPNNTKQAKMINSTIFSDDVLGRIDVTRTFNGRELNTEYGFGLFANIALNPGSFTLLGIPQSYKITHFAANQNIYSAAVVVDFNITALELITPVEIDFWATINERKQITQYDATFRWLDWEFAHTFNVGKKVFGIKSKAALEKATAEKLADSICSTAQTYCNGTNQQYNSTSDCKHFLTQEVPFGQAWQLGDNTLLCRMVHQNMVPYRPAVHCPHIGPTGGGYCTDDRTYEGVVNQPYFKHQPFVPYGYADANETIAAM